MPATPDEKRLIHATAVFLQDARDAGLSTHTRFSAAMNALGCLRAVGLGSEADQRSLDAWESTRYDPHAWPTEGQVAIAIERVAHLLDTTN